LAHGFLRLQCADCKHEKIERFLARNAVSARVAVANARPRQRRTWSITFCPLLRIVNTS
jgi:hypothetical protein